VSTYYYSTDRSIHIYNGAAGTIPKIPKRSWKGYRLGTDKDLAEAELSLHNIGGDDSMAGPINTSEN
jgi:hypothetical protein